MTPTKEPHVRSSKSLPVNGRAPETGVAASPTASPRKAVYKTLDGCEAAAYVAYRLNEVMAIYPITPSSPIAEWCDQWASEGKKNIWGTIPSIIEMQSEGGAVGRSEERRVGKGCRSRRGAD